MISETVIYRWSDGSTATCEVKDDEGPEAYFCFCFPGKPKVEFWPGGSTMFGDGTVEETDKKKVLGFFLDVGASRPNLRSHFFHKGNQKLRIPIYVPDELWGNRYEQIDQIAQSKEKTGEFLLWKVNIRLRDFVVIVLDPGTQYIRQEGTSIKEVIDDILAEYLILPQSCQDAWESQNAEHGSWVLPSQEEVEIYRALGEQLPFWWKAADLETWLQERR